MVSVSRRNFKLIVKDRGNISIDLLSYIDNTIQIINEMGVYLDIQKINQDDIDKDLKKKLHSKGILRLPALVDDKGKVYMGMKSIQDLIENNQKRFEKRREETSKSAMFKQDFSTNPDLADFWSKEMSFDAYQRDGGKQEESGFGDDRRGKTEDFNRRISDVLSDRKRRYGGNNSENDRRRGGGNQGPPTMRGENPRHQTDNNQDEPEEEPQRRSFRPADNIAREPISVRKGEKVSDEIFEQRFLEQSGMVDF